MENGIDIALLIGIIMNLTKGADLILLSSQKKKIQENFEIFTLWLDDIKPITWFKPFTTPKAQKLFLTIGVIQFFIIALIEFIFKELPAFKYNIDTIKTIIMFIGLFFVPQIIKRFGLKISKWLVQHANTFKFVFRYIFIRVFSFSIILFVFRFLVFIISFKDIY